MARKLSDYPKGIVRKWKRYKVTMHNKYVEEHYKGQDIYYVVRPNMQECGIASIIRYVLGHVNLAEQKGWKLVMDYQNLKNPYLAMDEIGKYNAWEFFFEQPCGVSLKDIEEKDNVIQTEYAFLDVCPSDSVEFFTNDYSVAYWRDVYRRNIRLADSARRFIDEERTKIFGDKKEKILGCVVRGTDYIQGRPWNHPIQPLPEDALKKAKQVMEEEGFDKVFLATEDENVLQLFKDELGEKLLYVEQQRYTDGSIPIAFQEVFATKSNRKEEGLKYLTVIYLLAECQGILAGRCGITTIAYLIADGFEYEYLWNLGRYHIDEYCLPERYQ